MSRILAIDLGKNSSQCMQQDSVSVIVWQSAFKRACRNCLLFGASDLWERHENSRHCHRVHRNSDSAPCHSDWRG